MSRYNKATGSWRDNDVDNASIEIYFSEHTELSTRVTYHQTVVLFTEESLF